MFRKIFLFAVVFMVCMAGKAQNPCANIAFSANQVGSSVNFVTTVPVNFLINSVSWNFGDGGTSTILNPSHTYANSGVYLPCLSITGFVPGTTTPITCTTCDSILVNNPSGPCNASFTSTMLSSNSLSFTNTSSGAGTLLSTVWNFGDGNTSSQANPIHTYTNSGWYNVCLTMTYSSSSGGTTSCNYCDSVFVQSSTSSPCVADFSYNFSNCSYFFSNTSTGTGTLVSTMWNFGDGGTSNATNPMHTYAGSGVYPVCLTVVYVDSGLTTSCTYCDTMWVNCQGTSGPCNADFIYTSSGTSASFNNTSTGSGTLVSSSWTFGDGGTSTATNPVHTYTNQGWYNVCLNVVYVDSGVTTTCTYCDSIFVGVPVNPCNADFMFVYMTNGVVNFLNTSSGSGSLTGLSWTFGDGGTSSLMNPTHSYSTTGWYNVCLTVTYTSSGQSTTCTYCDSIFVQVNGVGPCNAMYTYGSGVGNAINFTNTSTGGGIATSVLWNFGDGNISTSTNPSHTYANAGWYNVCLTMTYTNLGTQNTCTYCDSVYVQGGGSGPCNANFSSQYLSSNNLAFTNTSTGSGVLTSSSWTFGDGGTSTSTNPSHTYAQVGWYNVCLTVMYSSATGSHTCTTCDSVYVQSVGGGTSGNCFANAAFNQTISGNTVSFSNSSTCNLCTSVSYIWNFGDASALSTVVNPTHTYNAGGSYNVCLIINGVDSNQQVCSDTLCKPINVGSSALDEVEVSHLNIYPNPASGMIEINIPTSNQFQVHILDVSGRIQSTKKFNNHQGPVQMPVGHFASGLYFIRAESDGQKWHGSFIKK